MCLFNLNKKENHTRLTHAIGPCGRGVGVSGVCGGCLTYYVTPQPSPIPVAVEIECS